MWGKTRSRVGRVVDWRRALPVVFLGSSLAVAGFGAFEAWRAERSHRDTATGVLRDYAHYAARGFQGYAGGAVRDALSSVFARTRNNVAFTTGTATGQCLLTLLDSECRCSSGPVTGDWSLFTRLSEEPEAEWAGAPPTPSAGEDVLAALRQHARTEYQANWNFAMVRVPNGPTVAYTRMERRPLLGERYELVTDTLIWAVEVDARRLEAVYRRALARPDLLPSALTRGRPTSDFVQLEVVAADGRSVFQSKADREHLHPAEVTVSELLGGGVVRASVLPEMADDLVIGGLPENRAPVLLLIVLLAGALAAAALVQMRREAHLARLRQDFVASVSHELRTPLAQLRLFTETLRLGRTRNEEQRVWALDNLDRETRRLSQLVENILHFSRAERGVECGGREPLDLATELHEAVDAFRPLVPTGRARITVTTSGALIAAVHKDSIRQVVLNYLDNAVRYGPAGQTIRVGGERRSDRIVLWVDDEGPGVPVDERDVVFEPFRRGERQVGTVAAGSGIGLSVVREIAQAHDGAAWVEEAPGGGARFVLEVAAVETASIAPAGRRSDHLHLPASGAA